MTNIVKNYKDTYEFQRDQLRTALNNAFKDSEGYSRFELYGTWPDSAIVKDWNENKYYEIPYTKDEKGNITFQDPVPNDELFSPAQINNSMKKGQPLILLNSENKNPVYRVLVQTSEELPAHDMGLDKIKYDPDGIKTAIHGLVGEYVYDETQSNHNRKRNGQKTRTKFAQVVNADYCPDYGGYADFEVFDPNYVPMMEQALNSRMTGLPVKEGPSTELVPRAGKKYDENNLLLTEFDYNGIVWDKNPRDQGTGICEVVLNSLPDDIGDDSVTDKVELSKDEYNELVQAKTDKEELSRKYEEGKGLYAKGKDLYKKAKDEIHDLKEQLIPVWTAQEQEKVQLVNSLIEKVPDADKESMKTFYEGKDLAELEIIGKQVLNSIPGGSNEGGVIEQGGTPPGSKTKIRLDQFRQARKAKRF